jgi:hypothetical protein
LTGLRLFDMAGDYNRKEIWRKPGTTSAEELITDAGRIQQATLLRNRSADTGQSDACNSSGLS